MALYPEDDYTSLGFRFSDIKQSFDLTAHNLSVTHALNKQTWNAMVALESAAQGMDQSYYCMISFPFASIDARELMFVIFRV